MSVLVAFHLEPREVKTNMIHSQVMDPCYTKAELSLLIALLMLQ